VPCVPLPCCCLAAWAGDYQFEQAMLNATACTIHTFDCTTDGRSQEPSRHFYHKWCIGSSGQDSSYRSWQNITTTLGHSQVHPLKMDIEAFEYPVLSEFRPHHALPSEISLEFHVGKELPRTSATAPTLQQTLRLSFFTWRGWGMRPYSQEVNALAPFCCSEFSFLRVTQH